MGSSFTVGLMLSAASKSFAGLGRIWSRVFVHFTGGFKRKNKTIKIKIKTTQRIGNGQVDCIDLIDNLQKKAFERPK